VLEKKGEWHTSSERLAGLCKSLLTIDGIMQTNNTDVLFTGSLLGLDKSGGTVNADNQTTSNFGVKGSRVSSLLYSQDSSDPCDNFMTTGVCWLVEVNDSISDVIGQVSVLGTTSSWNWGVVSGSDIKTGKVLEEQRPLGSVDWRSVGGFDAIHFEIETEK
jgi:hypothetical protein